MPVDTLDPTWINAPGGVGPSYDSEELRRNQAFTIARGTTPGSARAGILAVGDLALSLSGMNVRLGAGGCVVATAKGAYVTGFAATTTVDALQAADVTNPRRDRVVIEILDPDNGGGAGRKGQARVITGTPNASAATGGGYPAEPSGPVLTIGYVDVPKSGAGSPVVTMTAPYTAAAGAPIPVRSQAEADALPKWDGALRVRLDLPDRLVQVSDGTKWVTASRTVRTDLNVGDLKNQTGTVSRIVADLTIPTKPYARIIRVQAQSAITPASIASGVSTNYLAVSLMQSASSGAQGKAPLSWTAPGGYILGATVDSGEVLVPANTAPLARMWVHVAAGTISTTLSGDATITKFWAEERPADA